ncbi:alpha beta-hydrolase [Roridomyces roridus]|uniref:Alpha beta-hydrolase n=1 Tax=Roridomyces roridus TaxID=1738132 RepID=A0AAD7FQ14_9AGAR|nr:alpha beta-hydrolase [Roridomyces roridus]
MAPLGLFEIVKMNVTLLQIPFFLIYVALFGRRSKRANGRPLGRVLGDETSYFVLSNLSLRQLQAISGSTLDNYKKWAKKAKIEPVVDDIAQDARLIWIGPRETENVLIYCHGGGFVGPLSDFQVEFWYRVQQGLRQSKNLKMGVAILQYSVHPVSFPAQLNQLLAAIQHVSSMGVPMSKISLAGDSAGANMLIQLISHILHPSSLVSPSPAASTLTGFAGICLISPWTLPSTDTAQQYNDSFDLLPFKCLKEWTDAYLSSIPDSHIPYVQPDTAPAGWFSGIDKITNRILITAGEKELMYPAIMRFSEMLDKSHHSDVQLNVQDNGAHCDPMFDIAAKATAPHLVEKQVTEWFAETIGAN